MPMGKLHTINRKQRVSKAVKKYVRKQVYEADRRFKDTVPVTTVNTTSLFNPLNLLTTGDNDEGEFTGNRVKARSLDMKLTIVPGSSGTSATVRHLIVWDKDNSAMGTLPAVSTLFDATPYTNAHRRMDTIKRYNVLYDKTFQIDGTTASPAGAGSRTISKNLKLNLPYTYYESNGASSGLIGNIKSGGIYSLILSNKAVGSTAPSVSGSYRLHYEA